MVRKRQPHGKSVHCRRNHKYKCHDMRIFWVCFKTPKANMDESKLTTGGRTGDEVGHIASPDKEVIKKFVFYSKYIWKPLATVK